MGWGCTVVSVWAQRFAAGLYALIVWHNRMHHVSWGFGVCTELHLRLWASTGVPRVPPPSGSLATSENAYGQLPCYCLWTILSPCLQLGPHRQAEHVYCQSVRSPSHSVWQDTNRDILRDLIVSLHITFPCSSDTPRQAWFAWNKPLYQQETRVTISTKESFEFYVHVALISSSMLALSPHHR